MQSYKSIISEIKKLQTLAEKRRRKELSSVIAGIRKTMKEYGITIEDLGSAGRGPRTEKVARPAKEKSEKSAKDKRAAVAPKYRDPDTGATWTGRGLTPKWLAAHEQAGRPREEFLIQA